MPCNWSKNGKGVIQLILVAISNKIPAYFDRKVICIARRLNLNSENCREREKAFKQHQNSKNSIEHIFNRFLQFRKELDDRRFAIASRMGS